MASSRSSPTPRSSIRSPRPTAAEHDRAIRFDDPAIGIDWPIDRGALILSDKDRAAPLLADVDTGF